MKIYKKNKFSLTKKIFLSLVLVFLVSMTFFSVEAADYEDYAPILYFEGQETCFPIDASYHINNANLDTFVEGYSAFLPISASSVPFSSITTLIPGITDEDVQYTYLDNTIGSIDDKEIIKDYKSKESSLGYKVYYRSFSSSANKVIQYWMFYAFNDGDLNKHEGDWEMVQVVIPSAGSSKWVAYSQHHSGQKANWDQVEKTGSNIKVYVARGSHANYLRSFSGKLGIGMGSDYVGANGKILEYGDYELEELSTQSWLNYSGHWGEVNSIEDIVLGKAGPYGPKYRESGAMWDSSVSWGNSLTASSDMMFTLEWFIYYFVEIFIAISIISLVILFVRIYLRHKKYGLGPRFLSILYIDGFNLRSIGNILFFIAIILTILGLFYPWYSVSGNIDVQGTGTNGLIDIITLDGIEGVKLNIPSITGTVPVGSVVIPFSLIIGLGLVFMILSTIGVIRSRKLGWKFLFRGIRLVLPIVLILVVIMLIGSSDIVESALPSDASSGGSYVNEIMDSFTGAPAGGEKSIAVSESGISGTISLRWGLGIGAYLLLFGGIMFLVAGIFEIIDNKNFYEPKVPFVKGRKQKNINKIQQPPVQNSIQNNQKVNEDIEEKSNGIIFCPECGNKLDKDSPFCKECGKKID